MVVYWICLKFVIEDFLKDKQVYLDVSILHDVQRNTCAIGKIYTAAVVAVVDIIGLK
jgi:hypothetical protein